jgi:hypothetical protein
MHPSGMRYGPERFFDRTMQAAPSFFTCLFENIAPRKDGVTDGVLKTKRNIERLFLHGCKRYFPSEIIIFPPETIVFRQKFDTFHQK